MGVNAGVKLVVFYGKSLKLAQFFIPKKISEIFGVVSFVSVRVDIKKMVGVGYNGSNGA